MKTMKYIVILLLPLLTITACKEESIVDNPSGETIVYSVYIANGGLSGGTRYNGIVDEATHTLTFNDVAAETDIQQLKFSGKISLGAHFDQESYDFYNASNPAEKVLEKPLNIVSGNNLQEYRVVVNLIDPESDPMVGKIEVETASGRVINGVVDLSEKWIYLNVPNEAEVTVKSIALIPARTSYTFTNAVNNKLSKSNPGYINLSFLGMTDSYRISFDEAPVAGINFGAPIVHDFSTNTTVWSDLVNENTRSADFDGEYVLLVSREGGTLPKLLRASDILSNATPTPIMLSTKDIAGGTYVISSGRLMQGHIYICNLTTGLADTDAGKLKLYHYASPTADPELVLDFGGVINEATTVAGRFGDNMSMDLDEDGNGYAYFVSHIAAGVLRFTVTNFTAVGEPKFIADVPMATYYGCYNQVGAENAYLFTSTAGMSQIQLRDKEGVLLSSLDKLGNAGNGTDAHIINYNSGRYLIMTSGRQQSSWPFPTLFIYDLSEGFNTVAAFVAYNNAQPDPVYTYQLGEATQAACSGIAAWAAVDGKLCILAAGPKVGFVLIEFPKNQK
ncbi:MAG: DUF4623 domain-containing protein [Dysgonamonadaceae bacterium]|nr:DUF4623 domain-containing protein [Dysgonamonadaceae bacterium]